MTLRRLTAAAHLIALVTVGLACIVLIAAIRREVDRQPDSWGIVLGNVLLAVLVTILVIGGLGLSRWIRSGGTFLLIAFDTASAGVAAVFLENAVSTSTRPDITATADEVRMIAASAAHLIVVGVALFSLLRLRRQTDRRVSPTSWSK